MKILFVQKVKALVGSEKYFLELIPALEKKGIETAFICIYSQADKEKTIPFILAYKALGLSIHVLEIKSEKSILKAVRFIKGIHAKNNFDLIHSHLIHADFWSALLKKIYRIKTPVVSTKHGYDEAYISVHGFDAQHLKPNRYLNICKFSEKQILKSFAVSNGLRQLFIDAEISKTENISTIHHGFDLKDVKVKPSDQFRKSSQQLVILGRIIPFKGHIHLIEALAKVKANYSDVHLSIIGHGDEELIKHLKERIAALNLISNVTFTGYQSNIYDYLGNADLMVVPSISEGFGLIFLEALNAKIPIIGFNVPATNEIIIHGENGFLVPLKNEDELAEKITLLLGSPELRNEFSIKGFTRLKEYYSLSRMVDQTIDFYESAI
jgi:glycosyltransferase involved in cell wall biosynthesis